MQDLTAPNAIVPVAPDPEDGYHDRSWRHSVPSSTSSADPTPEEPAEDDGTSLPPMTGANLDRTVGLFLWASTRQPVLRNASNLAEGVNLGTKESAQQWIMVQLYSRGLVSRRKFTTPGKKGCQAQLIFNHRLLRKILGEAGRTDDIGNWEAGGDGSSLSDDPSDRPTLIRELSALLNDDEFRTLLEGLEADWRSRRKETSEAD